MPVIPILSVGKRLMIKKPSKNMTGINFTDVGNVNASHKFTKLGF